jgi:hypothetical protein
MNRWIVSLMVLSLADASCALPIDSESDEQSAPAEVIPDTPCLRCPDWLAYPAFIANGDMCVASVHFAEDVVSCAVDPPGLGDCPDINLSRPPNPECLAVLRTECDWAMANCEQDIALP